MKRNYLKKLAAFCLAGTLVVSMPVSTWASSAVTETQASSNDSDMVVVQPGSGKLVNSNFLKAKRVVKAKQPRKVRLSVGRTYTKYDITRDGRKDRISTRYSYSGGNNYLTITINGRTASTIVAEPRGEGGRFEVYLCTVDTNREFLSVRFESYMNDHQSMHKLYKYKSGKLVCSFNVNKRLGIGSMQSSQVTAVRKNVIVFHAGGITSYGLRNDTYVFNPKSRTLY